MITIVLNIIAGLAWIILAFTKNDPVSFMIGILFLNSASIYGRLDNLEADHE